MATFTADIVFSAGAANTGQAANVLYTVIDAGGVTRIASTGSGVSEETDAAGNTVTGVYRANVTLDTSWQFPLRIKFVITGKAGVAGLGTFPQDRAMTLDLTQTLTLTTGATVGGALSSALTRFLKQVVVGVPGQSGSSLKIYKADGTTLLATIDLSTVNQAIP
jgi:hypothetical protein